MTAIRKVGRGALWVLPLVLVVVAFLAATPWLQTIGQPIAILVAAAVVIFGTTYANYLSFRAMRGLDEVQKAGAAFAAQWGPPAGQAAFCLLLMLPPFIDFTIAVASKFAVHSGMTMDRTSVVVSLTLGLFVLVLLEAIGRVVVLTIWWKDKQ